MAPSPRERPSANAASPQAARQLRNVPAMALHFGAEDAEPHSRRKSKEISGAPHYVKASSRCDESGRDGPRYDADGAELIVLPRAADAVLSTVKAWPELAASTSRRPAL